MTVARPLALFLVSVSQLHAASPYWPANRRSFAIASSALHSCWDKITVKNRRGGGPWRDRGGGGSGTPGTLPWLRPCLKSRVRRQFKLSRFRFKPVLRHICLEKVQTCPYTTHQCLPLLKRLHICYLHGTGISSDCFYYLQVCWCWWYFTTVPLWPY